MSRILIVEDDPAILCGLRDNLRFESHEVLTAVALCDATRLRSQLSCSRVRFRTLGPQECAAYWETGEPCDKAGAYAIQGLAAVFVAELSGSYSGVMGLPLFETAQILGEAGIARWSGR